MEFGDVVNSELTLPILNLCKLLASEKRYEEYTYFAGLLPLLSEPEREDLILAAVLELSKCAFLGFEYSSEAACQIDQLLERSINLAHTMSAEGRN